jgi:hypothetical protein
LVFGLTLPADATPVVRETLEAFAFDGGEATDGHGSKGDVRGLVTLLRSGGEGRADILLGNLSA